MKIAVPSNRPSLEGDVQNLIDSLYLLIIDVDTLAYHSLSNPFADGDDTDQETTLVFDLVAEDVQVVLTSAIPPNTDSELEGIGIQTLAGKCGTVREVFNQFKSSCNADTRAIPDDKTAS